MEDIKQIYPGYINGKKENGLQLKTINTPTISSENLEEYIPPEKIPRELNEIEEEIDNHLSPQPITTKKIIGANSKTLAEKIHVCSLI